MQEHCIIYVQHFGRSTFLIDRLLDAQSIYGELIHSVPDLLEPKLEAAPRFCDYLARVYDEESYYLSPNEAKEAFEVAMERFNNVTLFKYQRAYASYERQKERQKDQDTNLHSLILQNCGMHNVDSLQTKCPIEFYPAAGATSGIPLVKLILTISHSICGHYR